LPRPEGSSSETGRPIPYIDQVALDFPELVIVGGHVGYPWTEEMIAVCRKHPNVYIDTSAYTSKRLPPELVSYMNSQSGRSRVLFGTNWPMVSPARPWRTCHYSVLTKRRKASIWTETQEGFSIYQQPEQFSCARKEGNRL